MWVCFLCWVAFWGLFGCCCGCGSTFSTWLRFRPCYYSCRVRLWTKEKLLSDYYLAVRDPEVGEFFGIRKDVKGLTAVEIIYLNRFLKESAISGDGHHMIIIPRIVVEVAYNEIQRSSRYKS